MANTISGLIRAIGETKDLGKNGNSFYKREFVIQALRFNPDDGKPELSEYNTPILEVNGIDNCKLLDMFKVGDVVKVSFALEGRKVTNQEGKERYFNSARAYAMEKMNVKIERQDADAHASATVAGQQGGQQAGQAWQAGQQAYTNFGEQQSDKLPF